MLSTSAISFGFFWFSFHSFSSSLSLELAPSRLTTVVLLPWPPLAFLLPLGAPLFLLGGLPGFLLTGVATASSKLIAVGLCLVPFAGDAADATSTLSFLVLVLPVRGVRMILNMIYDNDGYDT